MLLTPAQTEKKCSNCKDIKPLSGFFKAKHGKFGVRSECKACSSSKYAIWQKTKGREKALANNKKFYESHKDTMKYKWSRFKSNAKQRNKMNKVTFEMFAELWNQPCHYCGDEVFSAGIDRVDSSAGYVKGNIVRCCEKCNRAKSNMTVDEFISHCQKVVAHVTHTITD